MPQSVKYEMVDISQDVIEEIGLDHTTFDIELFRDAEVDPAAIPAGSTRAFYQPARCASPRAYSPHHSPAGGPPWHSPSDSPGTFAHR